MEVLHGLDGLRRLPPGSVGSIGNFDGVHRGHQRILQAAARCRHRLGAPALAAISFEPHPLTVLRPELAPPRLTPPHRKESLLREAGVDHLVLLPPERAILDVAAEAFFRILRDEARIACLIEGDEFNFGKGRGGTIERLREWTAGGPLRLEVAPPVQVALLDLSVVRVSSSIVRWLVANGRMRDAAICLGRPYMLEGAVVTGRQRGRTIGMPTANLDCGAQLVPADGVYAGRCRLASGEAYPAAVSIGTMPTFNDTVRQIEAHLIGFDGDLYGQAIQLEVLDWIRDQRKYDGVDALLRRMRADIGVALQRQKIDVCAPIAACATEARA